MSAQKTHHAIQRNDLCTANIFLPPLTMKLLQYDSEYKWQIGGIVQIRLDPYFVLVA